MKCFSLFDRDYRSGNLSSTPNTSFSCQTSIRPSNICIIRSVFFKPMLLLSIPESLSLLRLVRETMNSVF